MLMCDGHLWTICVHVRDISSQRRPPNFQPYVDSIFLSINICGFPLAAEYSMSYFYTLYIKMLLDLAQLILYI